MIGPFFVIQVPDSSDKEAMAPAFRPVNSFALRSKCSKNVISMVFDHVIGNCAALRATFGPSFHINVRHCVTSHPCGEPSSQGPMCSPSAQEAADFHALSRTVRQFSRRAVLFVHRGPSGESLYRAEGRLSW